MTLNVERFQQIHQQITSSPDTFNMTAWETCGTARCVAGWAIFNETGEPLADRHGRISSATEALFERLEVHSYSAAAGKLLGITAEDANILFYSDNERALKVVAAAASGDEEAYEAAISAVRTGLES